MATICGIDQIDSNRTALAFAEEECPGILPTTPVWYGQEPNSYSDFKADVTKTARTPINASRSRQKGSTTDLDVSGGYNSDLTPTVLTRLMQGFFFASARQQPGTKPLNSAQIPFTSVDATNGYTASGGGLPAFASGDIVYAANFGIPGNNGAKVLTAASGTALNATGLTAETSPPAGATVHRVGKQFASADVAFSFAAGIAKLTCTAGDFTTLGLIPGQWVFIGGDSATLRFANNVGYARVSVIAAKSLTLDQTTFTPVTEAGTGKTIQLFTGTVIRNETDPSLIIERTYQFERQLGADASGNQQSEYFTGMTANTATLNLKSNALANVDIAFVGLDNEQYTGAQGVKAGTRVAAPGEAAFNTSSDVYAFRMYIPDPANPYESALFGYCSDGTIKIDNGVTANKAIGTIGGFSTSAGDFTGSGSVTAYFTNIQAVQAIRNNADVGVYSIMAHGNKGVLFDFPLTSLSGGSIDVEKDKPITLAIDIDGAQSSFGHTLLSQWFGYLPTIAMPT